MRGARGPRLSRRREYLDEYKKDASGKYVYTGKTYTYTSGRLKSRRVFYAVLWLLFAVSFAALIVCGLFHVPGMLGCAYVLIPYTGAVVVSLTELWGMTSLSISGHPLTKHDYETTVQKLPRRAAVTMVCSALTVLGEIVYLIINGSGGVRPLNTVFFFILLAAAFCSCFIAAKLLSKATWTESAQAVDPDA